MQESRSLLDWSQASKEAIGLALPDLFEQVPQLKLHQVGGPAVTLGFLAQQGMAAQLANHRRDLRQLVAAEPVVPAQRWLRTTRRQLLPLLLRQR
jgi:hypothetical protein